MHYQYNESYNTNKEVPFKTSMLRSHLCDYSDAYILLSKGLLLLQDEIILHMTRN